MPRGVPEMHGAVAEIAPAAAKELPPDAMYPAHHTALLSELEGLRRQREDRSLSQRFR